MGRLCVLSSGTLDTEAGWVGVFSTNADDSDLIVSGGGSIRLPAPATVRDAFSGATLAKGQREFAVTLERGETRAWWVEE